MKLHTVNHNGVAKNRYCGPSALSIITGLDTGRTAALLRKVTGKRSIKGTHTWQMCQALEALGYFPVRTFNANAAEIKRPTLRQWAKTPRGQDIYLVSVGHHWAVVQGRRYSCGLTKGVVSIKESPKARARVREALRLVRSERVNLNTVAPLPVRKPDPERKDRVAAKRLAAQWGIEIDNDREATGNGGYLWVYPSACLHDEYGEMPDDPYTEHYHDTWGGALEAAQTYAKLAEVKSALDSAAEPAIITAS